MKKHNFNPGPAILPAEVIREAGEGVLDLSHSGLSVLEISHRSQAFSDIMERGVMLVKELMGLSDDHHVLFLSGGASSQFFMVPMNLLNGRKAYYLDTGSWASKAIKEAKLFGQVEVLASSKDQGYTSIPKSITIPDDGVYLHLTSNNTIFGTQYHQWPESNIPLVCDMSSDLLSRPVPVENFGIIYGGAQKNLGPSGTTLVIIRKDMLAQVKTQLPSMLDYRTHVSKNSLYNTPPVFPIYVSMLTLQWLKQNGGLSAAETRNKRKADILYQEIDRNSMFRGIAEVEDRSVMNVTFRLINPELEPRFLEFAQEAGCVGLKGHRSVGGLRASLYNALPEESVSVLVEIMKRFQEKYG